MMSTYPLHVLAQPEPRAGRWLWLVKWVLVLPHCVVLALLWLGFLVLSIGALVAIVITGRYPRVIFDFNVGVLRWSWRVAYYAYGALGTDRYPPFTLRDVPDYPARLDVAYPEHLSRGLALVKWWLLAIPHYLVLAFLLGGGLYVATDLTADQPTPWVWGGGLIGLLALIAAVVLLVTGRYPQSLYDLLVGLNRWALRVAAYAGLMTDQYPPFRLDLGGAEPDDRSGPHPARGIAPPVASAGSQELVGGAPPAPTTSTAPSTGWTGGRVVALVLGSLLLVGSAGLGAGGASLAIADATMRDPAGFVVSAPRALATETYAIRSTDLRLHLDPGSGDLPWRLLGDAQVTVTSRTGAPMFLGVAPSAEVESYLRGVGHATVVDLPRAPAEPVYRTVTGGAPSDPATAGIWVAQSSGTGTQTVVVPFRDGNWTVVVLRADGRAGVAADVAVGANVPGLGWLVAILLSVAGTGLIIGAVVVAASVLAARDRHGSEPVPPALVGST